MWNEADVMWRCESRLLAPGRLTILTLLDHACLFFLQCCLLAANGLSLKIWACWENLVSLGLYSPTTIIPAKISHQGTSHPFLIRFEHLRIEVVKTISRNSKTSLTLFWAQRTQEWIFLWSMPVLHQKAKCIGSISWRSGVKQRTEWAHIKLESIID